MHIATAHSAEADTQAAVAAAHASLVAKLGGPPQWWVVTASITHAADRLREALRRHEGAMFHGASSCIGAMTETGAHTSSDHVIALLGIRDPDGDYGVGMAELGDDPATAAATALRRAIASAGRAGESPALVWVTAAPGHEEACITGIETVVGHGVPIVGGSAADNAVAGDWYLLTAEHHASNAVIVSVLYPSTSTFTAFQSGYTPTPTTGRVTRAEGRTIYEIDGQPAAQRYNTWTDGAIAEALAAGGGNILAQTTMFPLGRHVGQAGGLAYHRLAHPAAVTSDGGL